MAKKEMTSEEKHQLFEDVQPNQYSENTPIEDITRDSMIKYGSYIIEERAIPSLLDGLKPVQRRSLYTLKTENHIGTKTVKLARIVGNVMGKLHPHGDSSIVGTFVNMSQPFKNNFMLLNPQGNYGDIENPGSHAAMRYIENGIEKKYADLLFENINKDNVVSWQMNYDDTLEEPKVLPVKYPYHLLNGSSGIAYSMATKIPSYNIKEITNLFIELIDDGFYQEDYALTEELKEKYSNIVLGPDFSTGTNVYFDNKHNKRSDSLFKNQFTFRMRATYEIDEENSLMKFTNMPYELTTEKLNDDIIDMKMAYTEQNKKKIMKPVDEILNINKQPVIDIHRSDATLRLEFRKDEDLFVELAKVFKGTDLDKSFACNNTVISEDGVPVSVSVFENLRVFLLFRRHVVYQGLLHDIAQLNKKIPLLEAYLKIMEDKDLFIDIITNTHEEEEMYQKLKDAFEINEEQIEFLLSIQVRRLTKKEAIKIEEELKAKTEERDEKIEISSSSENLFRVIKEDYESLLQEPFIAKADRRSKIIDEPQTFEKEDLIKDRQIILSLMSDDTIGWTENTIRAKARGTLATKTAKQADGVYVKDVINCNLKSHLAFITNYGRVFKLRGFDFNSKFYHISNVLNMQDGEKIVNITNLDNVTQDKEILFITKNGYGSKSDIDFFKHATKNRAIIGIRLNEGDEILSFNIVNKDDDIVLITKYGKGLRFPVSDVKLTKSAAKGVFVYKSKEDSVVSTVIVSKEDSESEIVVGFEYGGIKKFNISDLKTKKRNQVGLIITKTNDQDGTLVDGTLVAEEENILILSVLGESGLIKPHDIKSVSRTAVGIRKGIKLKKGDKVIKILSVEDIQDEDLEDEELIETMVEGVETDKNEANEEVANEQSNDEEGPKHFF